MSYLVVEVIKVAGDENVNVPHDLQNVQTLTRTHGYNRPHMRRLNQNSTAVLMCTLTCSRVWLGKWASVIMRP